MGIDAGFCLVTPSCVHRFLISSPDLRIDAGFSPFKSSCVHRFLISGPDLRIDAAPSSWRLRTVRLLRPSLHRPFASDSNFHSCKEEWPACYDRRDNGLPRPILIFEAAKKNGPPPTTVATTVFRVRFYSSLSQRRTARLQHSRGLQAGTGCYEGCIILSKKPPEWRLSLPQRPSESDSNLRRCKEERPACSIV